MHPPRRPTIPLLAAILAALLAPPAAAQEMSLPAVDESPSSQLLLEQAADQLRTNPREAVRLLVQALDAGPGLLVRDPADPDLFVPVARRVHAMLVADRSLLEAFRREAGADAQARLDAGDLEWVASRRLDTAAGLEASMRLAESDLARGRFSSARALLDRSAGHDLLGPARRDRHAALLALAVSRASGANAGSLGPGAFDRAAAGKRWGETWREPLGTATDPAGLLPLVRDGRVLLSSGLSVLALDRMTGSTEWGVPIAGFREPGGVHGIAAAGRHAVTLLTGPPAGGRPGGGGIACVDAADGTLRWEARLDRLGVDRTLDGAVPQGIPVIVDGRAIVAFRKATARFETVSGLFAVDVEGAPAAAWARTLATSGSIRSETTRTEDAPTVSGGIAYVATATGAVAAIDPRDGNVRWLRRFRVPVREAGPAAPAATVSAPAVVGGVVYAVSPDRSRLLGISCTDGTVVAELPTGATDGIGTPSCVVGDDRSGLVFAVGDRIACIRGADRPTVTWSIPADGAATSPGRVSVAWTEDPAAPVLVVPGTSSTAVLDARDGSAVLRLDGLGASSVVACGGQLIAAGAATVSSWMPVDEAERRLRERMAGSPDLRDAVALLSLARQVRSASIAEDAATEAARRAQPIPREDPSLQRLLDLLVSVDALGLAGGGSGPAVAAAIDRVAALAGVPDRAAFARAERELRGGDGRAAARTAAAAALASGGESALPVDGGLVSPDAAARRVIESVRLRGRPEDAAAGVGEAIDAAIAAAPAMRRVPVFRTAARLGAGTAAGDRALEAFVRAAAPGSPVAAAQLVRECRALGSRPGEPLLEALGEFRAMAEDRSRWPAVGAGPVRAVEVRGSLPRQLPDVPPMPGGLLTVVGPDLAFRPAPAFGIAWRVPIGSPSCTVVSTEPELIVCDDAPSGFGALTCIDREGRIRWTARPEGDRPEQDPGNAAVLPPDGEPRRIRSPVPVPLPTIPVIAVLRTDGSLVAFDRSTGVRRWERPAGANPPQAWSRCPSAIAFAEEIVDDSGQRVQVTVLDPANGSVSASWTVAAATEAYWLRIGDGALVVTATDAGIEARRLAGGDESVPYWTVDDRDAVSSDAGWAGQGSVAFSDGGFSLAAIACWTGRLDRGAAALGDDGSRPREVRFGPGWVAVAGVGEVSFVVGGAIAGRTAPVDRRNFVAIAAASDRLFAVEDVSALDDGAGLRREALLHEFDPRAGGMEVRAPLMLRTLIRGMGELAVVDGAVAVGNGSSVQVLSFPADGEGAAP